MKSKLIFKSQLIILIVISGSMATLTSCHTIKLPLCPKLSTTKPSPKSGISKTLYDICNEKNIKVTVLSSTVAEFKGSKIKLRWLVANYCIILCDFNQQTVSNDKAYYEGCMANAAKWIEIVQGDRLDTLMLNSTNYCTNCCE